MYLYLVWFAYAYLLAGRNPSVSNCTSVSILIIGLTDATALGITL